MMKYNNKSSSISLWLFLGSPVFISIILDSQLLPPLQLLLQPFAIKPLTRFSHRLWFWTCSCRHSESRDHCQTVATVILAPIVFLQVPLRSSFADLPSRGNLTIIGALTCRQKILRKSLHAPCTVTRLQALSRAVTRLHTPSRTCTRQVFSWWRHHCHVICWHYSPVSWRHRWPGRWLALTLTIDFSLGLTFWVQVLLTQFFA